MECGWFSKVVYAALEDQIRYCGGLLYWSSSRIGTGTGTDIATVPVTNTPVTVSNNAAPSTVVAIQHIASARAAAFLLLKFKLQLFWSLSFPLLHF